MNRHRWPVRHGRKVAPNEAENRQGIDARGPSTVKCADTVTSQQMRPGFGVALVIYR